MNTQTSRSVIEQMPARPASDGDGVKLLRVFGGRHPERFDPFLMLDEFGSEEASDYIGGFPPHPHRGFETITYMLQGKMEHKDHMGNVGLLNDGDVQWMTAGRGIIHSEMPQQTEGKMRGFQVWLNLPAKDKMLDADYKDLPASEIPVFALEGSHIKAIAGQSTVNGHRIKGYFSKTKTDPIYLDVYLAAKQSITLDIPDFYTALVYSYDNDITFPGNINSKAQTVSRLSDKGRVMIDNNTSSEARFIVLAGKPLKEPIAQHGPFVMNTTEEINQAISDYNSGLLTA